MPCCHLMFEMKETGNKEYETKSQASSLTLGPVEERQPGGKPKANQKTKPHWCEPPVEGYHSLTSRPIEGQNLTGAFPQSKDRTSLVPAPSRRMQLTGASLSQRIQRAVFRSSRMIPLRPCQGLIERHDFTAASPNRRRPENASRNLLLPGSKYTQFSYFFSFPSYFFMLLICL